MTKKLIVHAGFPKTGTTSLQSSLAEARSSLLTQGILYPESRGSAQHSAAWALTQKTFGWEGRGGYKTSANEWNELVKKVHSVNETVLLSSEFFSHTNQVQVEKFKSDMGVEDTTIVFTMRALAKILPSRYQQSLKKGNTWSYDEWLTDILQRNIPNPTTRKFGNYSNTIARWASVFGAENIVVVVVDENTPNLIFDAFHSILGLTPNTIVKAEDKALNRSLTTEETVLLAALNHTFKNEGNWKEYVRFVRNQIVKSWSGRPAVKEHSRIHTPEWAVDKAVELAEINIEHIKSLGIKVHGDLNLLASRNVLIGEMSQNTSIPATLASETLLSVQGRFEKRLARRDARIKRLIASRRPLYKVLLRRFRGKKS